MSVFVQNSFLPVFFMKNYPCLHLKLKNSSINLEYITQTINNISNSEKYYSLLTLFILFRQQTSPRKTAPFKTANIGADLQEKNTHLRAFMLHSLSRAMQFHFFLLLDCM